MREWQPCEVCMKTATDGHHVFFGSKNRHWSDKYGLVAFLCREHHAQAHTDREFDLELKRKYQAKFEGKYDRALFMRVFGRNYL